MLITYFMIPEKRNAPDLGTYRTYNIAAYGKMYRPPVAVVRDVSTDAELVVRMVCAFTRNELDPIHLKDAVLDMLE